MKKDFILIVLGQIISLFGNAILRFALPLYLLDTTRSAALFGLVSALSFIPLILLTPVGGLIADRVNKRNIMVALDFTTAGLILIFSALMGRISIVILLVAFLMLLYGIQGIYQPAVQASIPLLMEGEKLMVGNAIINQVSALSGLLGPVIGGILYGFAGIVPILAVGGVCFFLSAVMEIFIRIPHKKLPDRGGILAAASHDLKESIHFIVREKPVLIKGTVIISIFNLFLSSMIMIGLPVIIKQVLGLSDQMYGYTQGALAAGGLLGGIMTGALTKKMKVQNCYRLLFGAALLLIPMGAVLLMEGSPFLSWLVITVCSFLMMVLSTMFTIQMLTFVQGQTPAHLIGKVVAWVMTFSMCAQPVGQALYGGLFEKFKFQSWGIIFAAAVISGVISVFSKRIFSKIA